MYHGAMAIRIPAEIKEAMLEYARKTGAAGGRKAAANMTDEQLKERAAKAGRANAEKWAQKRAESERRTSKRKRVKA